MGGPAKEGVERRGPCSHSSSLKPSLPLPSPLPGPCFSCMCPGPRVCGAEDACMGVRLRRTSQAGPTSSASPSTFRHVHLVFEWLCFSVFRPSLQPHSALVCHGWTVWTNAACLEIWENDFYFVWGSVCAVFSEFLFPPL